MPPCGPQLSTTRLSRENMLASQHRRQMYTGTAHYPSPATSRYYDERQGCTLQAPCPRGRRALPRHAALPVCHIRRACSPCGAFWADAGYAWWRWWRWWRAARMQRRQPRLHVGGDIRELKWHGNTGAVHGTQPLCHAYSMSCGCGRPSCHT
jgi:hypothetical protein